MVGGMRKQVNESRGVGGALKGLLAIMYGPPPECKKNWVGRDAVCENVSGL